VTVERGTARLAFAGLVLFVVLVYSNPGNLFFPDEGDLGIAKAAAGMALLALGGSWLLADRPLLLGGAVGALLLCFYAWIALSATWSLWPSMTIDTLLDGLKYLAIYYLVANAVDSRRRALGLMHCLAWASLIPAVGAIWSWLHGEHLVEGDRAAWIGLFANPNDLAYHLVVGVAVALGARSLTRSTWVRVGYLGALATMGTAIALTQSRGGLMGSAVVLGLWALRGLKRGRTMIAVAVMAVLAVYFAPSETWHRAGTIQNYEDDASARGRIDAWRTGVNVFYARPMTGVGAGAFTLAWGEYAPGDAGPPRTAHNTFVQLLAETGLPSLLLFVGALGGAVFGLSRAARPGGDGQLDGMARTVQVGLGGFTVCSLTGGLAYSWPLYLLLGMATALAAVERREAQDTTIVAKGEVA
jgi:probable O-glycosylation ligase (exosortase A-associated)